MSCLLIVDQKKIQHEFFKKPTNIYLMFIKMIENKLYFDNFIFYHFFFKY